MFSSELLPILIIEAGINGKVENSHTFETDFAVSVAVVCG